MKSVSEHTHCFVFQNKLGDTALHAAAWKGHSDIVEMLLKKSEWLVLLDVRLVLFYGKALQESVFFFFCLSFKHLFVHAFAPDPRTDLRNNENKLAVDMATNARCASLLKRVQAGSKYSKH